MADKFEPDSQRAQKKFPQMRLTRAMAMDRIDYLFKTDRAAAIKSLKSLLNKGGSSGGFNSAETKVANKWYSSKVGSPSKAGGGGAMTDLSQRTGATAKGTLFKKKMY
jgi:hypothetical protein